MRRINIINAINFREIFIYCISVLIIILATILIDGCGGDGNSDGGGDLAGEINCTDKTDNDGDGEIDCADIDCILDPACPTCEEIVETLCNKEDECDFVQDDECLADFVFNILGADCTEFLTGPYTDECMEDLNNFECDAFGNSNQVSRFYGDIPTSCGDEFIVPEDIQVPTGECEDFFNATCDRVVECGIATFDECVLELLFFYEEVAGIDCANVSVGENIVECIEDLDDFSCDLIGQAIVPDSCIGVVEDDIVPPQNTQYFVPILAVRVSDDDGSRRANITPLEVKQWLDEANNIFSSSQIQFEFEPIETGPNWIDINSTDMNNVVGEFPGDPVWENSKSLGNEIAAEHPDKIAVFFRHGPGDFPTGGGFSWTRYNFIVMPGFQDSELCGQQNIVQLAHEIGHYLGLYHTFTQDNTTINEVEDFYINNGSNPFVFDGDGLSDTPPDPFIREIDCTSAMSVELNGDIFELLRDNNMSYYYHNGIQKTHTEQQIEILRQWLWIRFPFIE